MLYLRRGWAKLRLINTENKQLCTTSVCVMIAARNEERMIESTIQDILAQDYPANLLQLIVVDDHSKDRTSHIVLSFIDPRVKLINLNEKEPLN